MARKTRQKHHPQRLRLPRPPPADGRDDEHRDAERRHGEYEVRVLVKDLG